MLRRLVTFFYPSERIVAVVALVATAFYFIFSISGRDPIELYTHRVSTGLGWYAFGLLVCLFLLRLKAIHAGRKSGIIVPRSETLEKFKTLYANRKRVMHDLRLFHALSAMFVVFINLKHLLPFLTDTLYDQTLVENERWLFGGMLFAERLWQVLGLGAAEFLSAMYEFWYTYIAALILLMIFQRNALLANRFSTAFCLMWFLGLLLVVIFPTWGPCFFVPDVFEALPKTYMTELQHKLWMNKLHLDKNPMSEKAVFMISGLPSLHFAATILGSLFLSKVSKFLSVLSWLFCFLTFLSTIYFGWHYLLDDVASVVLVVLIWWVVMKDKKVFD